MKVILAGYNVDTDVIEDLKKTSHPREDVTPETLAASYARISRDPRPVDELRKTAREEVEKARKSNHNIIFNMGHHSVAEHAVFNFDIIDVSRLAIEDLEKFRLCSYTEKSQRYQALENNYILPGEIKGTEFESEFIKVINEQNELYKKFGELAPEDARYITSLATQAQLGMTVNARNLELIFRRFASNPLCEVFTLGKEMFSAVEKIAPSIILFTNANDFDLKTYGELGKKCKEKGIGKNTKSDVVLVEYTKNADDILISTLLHTSSKMDYKKCRKITKKMSLDEKREIIKTGCKYIEFYDTVLREFEHVNLTFELIVSSACFGQLKRHRMATITCQKYDPKLGVTVPQTIIDIGMEKEFRKVVRESEKLYYKIYEKMPLVAPYILTNAHRKRVLIKVNARELHHISRLREDAHAQWDIRDTSKKMVEMAKGVMPLAMLLIGGKDNYPKIYESVFGNKPKALVI